MAEATSTAVQPRKRQRRVGEVVSAKMDKTIVVKVTRRIQHPLYKRVVQMRKKFYAHDEHNQCREGDWVRIEETRPLSKLKRWRLVEVLEKARA
ncbi:MAG: 30S ribosomal protein S17 [Acidobacteria bacterium]|nr:30S ribosomal protein S17 [Acidobacteriota bacterium]